MARWHKVSNIPTWVREVAKDIDKPQGLYQLNGDNYTYKLMTTTTIWYAA